MLVKNAIRHFRTVHEHRKLVREGCFRIGLYKQGLLHDLSKYSPSEFLVGVKYYQGFRSPNNAERENKGYSAAWLHHKGRNKHHFEYWIDYSTRINVGFIPARMPKRYIAEMFCDRIAACKIYNGDNYTDRSPLEYYEKGKDFGMIEKHTKKELEKLLNMLATDGEEATERYIRKKLLRHYPGAIIAELCAKKRANK